MYTIQFIAVSVSFPWCRGVTSVRSSIIAFVAAGLLWKANCDVHDHDDGIAIDYSETK